MGSIIGMTGKIASGKTTISSLLAQELKIKKASFGEYVRKVAKERGEDIYSRATLQKVGELLINSDIHSFCLNVLKQVEWKPGDSVVIEGIRHVEVLKKLKEITAPSDFFLVFIDIDEKIRLDRIQIRDTNTIKEQRLIDNHSTEIHVKGHLLQMADIIINGNNNPDSIVMELVCKIRSSKSKN
jgi:dephospho-CoA kinase